VEFGKVSGIFLYVSDLQPAEAMGSLSKKMGTMVDRREVRLVTLQANYSRKLKASKMLSRRERTRNRVMGGRQGLEVALQGCLAEKRWVMVIPGSQATFLARQAAHLKLGLQERMLHPLTKQIRSLG
jgi:hypothetical protein